MKALQSEGFRLENGTLKDKDGNPVVFSIITNAGNKARERMAVLIQDDLQKIGIHVNVVTLDFPSLIERMTQSFDYEAILLGLTNVDLDPNERDERVAELIGNSSVESAAESSGNGMGSGNRPD